MLVIDPKGENARIAGDARERMGPLHVLDPFGLGGAGTPAGRCCSFLTSSLLWAAWRPWRAMGLMAGYGLQLWPILQDM